MRKRVREAGACRAVPHWYMYPPKQCYLEGNDASDLEVAARSVEEAINLYIHIPFCSMHCSFCTLFTKVSSDQDVMSRYVELLLRQISLFSDIVGGQRRLIRNLYVGGGTPSILPFGSITQLMEHITSVFDCSSINECSVELSPDAATIDVARAWRAEGFNRVSLGVQTFKDSILTTIGRKHDGSSAKLALKTLAACGFTNINADLIYGHPGQTLDDWLDDLKEIMDSDASCVTVHPLAVRSSSLLAKQMGDSLPLPSEQSSEDLMYNACIETLPAAGWKPAGAVLFSRNGRANQLEREEALGLPTVGIGAGARTYFSSLHAAVDCYSRKRSVGEVLSSYADAIEAGSLPILSCLQLDDEERVRRGLILGLMTGGASIGLLDKPIAETAKGEISAQVDDFLSEGLLVKSGTTVSLSYEGLKRASGIGLALSSATVRSAINERPR